MVKTRSGKLVTKAAHRFYIFAVVAPVDLFPEETDKDVHHPGFDVRRIGPYPVQDHLAREHAVGIGDQVFHQGVFLGRERDLFAIAADSKVSLTVLNCFVGMVSEKM